MTSGLAGRLSRISICLSPWLLAAAPPVHAGLAERLTSFESNSFQFQEDSYPQILGETTGGFVYAAFVPTLGNELWVATGNPPRPQLLPELCPGPNWFDIQIVGEVEGRRVVYADGFCNSPFESAGFFVTDGTAEGTRRLALEVSQPAISGSDFAGSMPRQTARLLFFAIDAAGGVALMATDGTDEGTEALAHFPFFSPRALAGAGGRHYFTVPNGAGGTELWVSDGTSGGTVRLRGFDHDREYLRFFPSTGSLQYFQSGPDAAELWRTNGTPAGTYPISQFPGAASGIEILETRGNRAFLLVHDSTLGQEIWTSDGSVAGTRATTSFGPEEPFIVPAGRESFFMAILGDRAYFNADDGTGGGRAYWEAGTEPGSARPVARYCPADTPDCPLQLETETVGSTVVYFATDVAAGLEPRYVDTSGAPHLLADVCVEPCIFAPSIEFSDGPYLGFFNEQGLWLTDGSPAGTFPLTDDSLDAPHGANFAGPGGDFVDPGLFFTGYDAHGVHLWYAEPPWLPVLVGPTFRFSPPPSPPNALLASGSELAFNAVDGLNQSIFKLDADAPQAPAAIAGPYELCSGNQPEVMAAIPGRLVFSDCSARKLWSSAEGSSDAILVKEFLAFGAIESHAVSAGILYFTFIRFVNPTVYEIWRSDGTPAGTDRILELPPGEHPFGLVGFDGSLLVSVSTSSTNNIVRVDPDGTATPLTEFEDWTTYVNQTAVVSDNSAYFSVIDQGFSSLWVTDGTPPGTFELVPLPGGATQAAAVASLPARDVVILNAAYTTTVVATDGAPQGTEILAHMETAYAFGPRSVTAAFEGSAYFTIDRDELGSQLLRTDGTTGNLFIVADLSPTASFRRPRLPVTPAGLYFAGWNSNTGIELWKIDSGSLTPRLVQDLAPGNWSSQPDELTLVGSNLFFTADDGQHGKQVWSLNPNEEACRETPTAICLEGSRFRVEGEWRDFAGEQGVAHAVRLSGDTGYFWFFDEENVELILKVLDGTDTNGHHWVYYGALSNVEYSVTITDSESGAALRIQNPALFFASAGDIEAFGPRGAHAAGETVSRFTTPALPPEIAALRPASGLVSLGACVPSPTRFCILGRFAVQATWRDFNGNTGVAQASTLTDDTGYLWFFEESNVEVVLKAVDGSDFNGHFWIYYGALSNVEYTITVTDTVSGTSREYRNPLGSFGSFGDIEAFPAP